MSGPSWPPPPGPGEQRPPEGWTPPTTPGSYPPPPPGQYGPPAGPPPGPPGYPGYPGSPPPHPPQPPKNRVWLWVALALVAVLAVGAGLVGLLVASGDSESDASDNTPAATSDTPPSASEPPAEPEETEDPEPSADPEPDIPRGPKFRLPPGAELFEGNRGWQMQTSSDWVKFDVPKFEEAAAWATGDGSTSFGNNINVLVEPKPVITDLPDYVKLDGQNIENLLDAKIVSTDVYRRDGRDYGRVEYTFTTQGIRVHGLQYIAEAGGGGWVIATYSATKATYDDEVRDIEPYLATLSAR